MITKERFNRGTGGVYKLTMSVGDDEAEFNALVKSTFEGIDFMRSPSIMRYTDNQGKAVAEIKYYGLD